MNLARANPKGESTSETEAGVGQVEAVSVTMSGVGAFGFVKLSRVRLGWVACRQALERLGVCWLEFEISGASFGMRTPTCGMHASSTYQTNSSPQMGRPDVGCLTLVREGGGPCPSANGSPVVAPNRVKEAAKRIHWTGWTRCI